MTDPRFKVMTEWDGNERRGYRRNLMNFRDRHPWALLFICPICYRILCRAYSVGVVVWEREMTDSTYYILKREKCLCDGPTMARWVSGEAGVEQVCAKCLGLGYIETRVEFADASISATRFEGWIEE